MGKKAQLKRQRLGEERKAQKEKLERIYHEKNPWLKFWKRVDFWVYVVALAALVAFPFVMKDKLAGSNMAIIHTSMGDISVNLYTEDAPKTVDNFRKLAEKGYYDNLLWHRVIKGFMIQGGDPTGTGSGGESASGQPFADEINPETLGLTEQQISDLVAKGYLYDSKLKSHKMLPGSLAMANSGPNTNGSQFFIVTDEPQPHLDGQHTVFGQVTSGMDVVRAIAEVAVDENDKPVEPVYITSVELK